MKTKALSLRSHFYNSIQKFFTRSHAHVTLISDNRHHTQLFHWKLVNIRAIFELKVKIRRSSCPCLTLLIVEFRDSVPFWASLLSSSLPLREEHICSTTLGSYLKVSLFSGIQKKVCNMVFELKIRKLGKFKKLIRFGTWELFPLSALMLATVISWWCRLQSMLSSDWRKEPKTVKIAQNFFAGHLRSTVAAGKYISTDTGIDTLGIN